MGTGDREVTMPEVRTAAATATNMRTAALRAVDDPASLAKAARIVRAALERGRLGPDDLRGDIVKPADLPTAGSAA
jgi:hypothetical protein